MKPFATLTAAIALLSGVSAANAADLTCYGNNCPGSLKDAFINPPTLPSVLPEGAYVTLGIGGALTDTKASGGGSAADFNFAGFLGSVRVGYDLKAGNWVIGPLAGVSFENVKSSAAFTGDQTFGYEAGIRVGRILNGDSLVYGLAAYQGQHIGLNNTSFASDLHGVKLGGGIEIDTKAHWIIGSEVDWISYGDWTPAKGLTISNDEIRAELKLGYRW